ncbi:MAG: addiction module protein [Myxococcota bacterium]|nr:addiction module protein [Myxococcota bacterium]
MASISLDDIRKLTVAERLRLVDQIWETIVANPETLPVTEAQRQELHRRLKAHAEDPDAAIPWPEARSRLEATSEHPAHS